MKNLRVICNYSPSEHATRFIKHYGEVKQFHLDVMNFGINNSKNKVFENLDVNQTQMILTSNPLTAFKLYTLYKDSMSFCMMDEDCEYVEVEIQSINELIAKTCMFDC